MGGGDSAARQLAGAIGDSIIEQVMEFFSGLSRLVVSSRVTHVTIMGYLGRWKSRENRRVISRCLDVLQRTVLPVMKAWSEFAANGDFVDMDRCAKLLRRVAVSVIAASRQSVAIDADGMLAAQLFNDLSDQIEDRNLAFSFARTGSCVLVLRVVLGRLMGIIAQCYAINASVSKFVAFTHLTETHAEEFARLVYADARLLDLLSTACRSQLQRSKSRALSTGLGPFTRFGRRPRAAFCRYVEVMIETVNEVLLTKMEGLMAAELKGAKPADGSSAKCYKVVNVDSCWTNVTVDRYAPERWMSVVMVEHEKLFVS